MRVVAEQFAWNFHYPGADGVWGRTDPTLVDAAANPLGLDRQDPAAKDDIHTLNNLYLPVNKPALLYLSSKDVIHSFFLPYMRVKHDAIPGNVVPIWFSRSRPETPRSAAPSSAASRTSACAASCTCRSRRRTTPGWRSRCRRRRPPLRPAPAKTSRVDVHSLPALNALLNGTSFVLLLIGYALIRSGRRAPISAS